MCKCTPQDTKCTPSQSKSQFLGVFAGWLRYGGIFRNATTKKRSSTVLPKSAPPDKILATPMVLITKYEVVYELSIVPKSVTLNDGVIARTLLHFTEFGSFRGALSKSGWKLFAAEMYPKECLFSAISLVPERVRLPNVYILIIVIVYQLLNIKPTILLTQY